MSPKIRPLELRILELLRSIERLRPGKIAFEIAGRAEPTAALRASVGRALASLRKKGQLVSVMGDWMLTETLERAKKQRARREQLRRRSKAQEPSEKRSTGGGAPKERASDVRPERASIVPIDYRNEGRRLIKVLALLGSPHEGEALNAARQAEEIRGRLRLSWEQIITLPDSLSDGETKVAITGRYGPNFRR